MNYSTTYLKNRHAANAETAIMASNGFAFDRNLGRRCQIISMLILVTGLILISLFSPLVLAQNETADTMSDKGISKKWAISQFGEPKYIDGLDHWPYVNPDAKKGGSIVISDFGSFDTLNFYVLKGDWPASIGSVYDDLMTSSGDEIDALYGLIAESVELPEDKSWAIFNIRPEARYHDGEPIRAKDFVLALNTIKENGRPFIKSFYTDVVSAEALDDSRLKFTFSTGEQHETRHYCGGIVAITRALLGG